MLRRQFHRLACLAFAVLLAASMAAPPALAHDDGDSGFFDGFVDSNSEVSLTDRIGLWAAEKASWVVKTTARYTDDPGNATRYADAFQSEFNSENATIVRYANSRLSPTSDYEVFRVHFVDRNDNNVTRYVVADEYNGVYEGAQVMTPGEFDDMNRQVDHWVALDWYQSKHAAGELDVFVDDYARPGENVSATYRASMLAEYGAPNSDLWPVNGSDA